MHDSEIQQKVSLTTVHLIRSIILLFATWTGTFLGEQNVKESETSG